MSLILAEVVPAVAGEPETYRQALNLYQNGLYDRARTMFESIPGDPLADGYAVLCALKLRTDDARALFDDYTGRYVKTSLSDMIHYEMGRKLFDEGRYADASSEFFKCEFLSVPWDDRAEYMFKKGYCHFEAGRYQEALQCFDYVDGIQMNDFSSPSAYLSGVIRYNARDFADAEKKFRKSVSDPRFSDISRFYIVDCEFNLKNYDFVIKEGGKIYETVPAERKEHLARMISESYLVRGDKKKAREFYQVPVKASMSRSDYFYAGSVLYAVEDYRGAIENFLKMTDRSDSLGQIANYQMGNSYLRIKNKVAAAGAFKAASEADYDAKIKEDALFNYAKLSFDLNKDTGGFADYISRYSAKTKDGQIYSYMALASLYDKDYAGAIEAYDHIDDLDGGMRQNYAKANYLRAEQLVNRGSYRDAVPYLRATSYYVDKSDRFNQLSRYWLGETNYRSGNYGEAGKIFTELYNAYALHDRPEGELLPYNVAYCFFGEGDWENASKWFDVYAKSGSKSALADAIKRRADCDFARKDYKAAIESYGGVISFLSDRNDIYPYYRQALSYGLAGDRKKKVEVLETLEDASPALPYFSEALYELGATRMELKRYDAAIAAFERLGSVSTDNSYAARALLGLGAAYRSKSDNERAVEYYKDAVNLMPGSEYAGKAMAEIESIYKAIGRPEKYQAYVEENSLINTEEGLARVEFDTAEQLFLAQNYNHAVTALRKYLDSYPTDKNRDKALFYLAESYNHLNYKETACDMYASLVKTSPQSPYAETAGLDYSKLSYELERFREAYEGYETLYGTAKSDANRFSALVGMMRSSFKDRNFSAAVSSADAVRTSPASDGDLRRESVYVKAKSCLAMSDREQAMNLFRELAKSPSTGEGAEARYILVQDAYDRGDFDIVESMIRDFSDKAGNELYWLARSYVILGDTFVELGKPEQAAATYKSIRDGYDPERAGSDEIFESIRVRLDRISNED